MANVPNGVEMLPKMSTGCRAHKRYRQTDDRQTDRQTDGRS